MMLARLRFRLPIRLQIVLLVALTLLPGLTLTIGQAFEHRRVEIAAARERLEETARAIADRHDHYLAEVERLTLTLAGASLLGEGPERCGARLKEAAAQMPRLWSIFVADLDGRMVCSSTGAPTAINVADRGYYRTALAERGFVVGEAVFTRGQNRPVLPTALPVLDERDGRPLGVLVASIRLAWLAEDAQDLAVGPSDELEIRDGSGKLLVGSAHGGAIPAAPSSIVGGVAAAVSPRLTTVALTETHGLEIRLSVARNVLEAPARARWARQMALIAGAAALAIVLGNLYGRFTIARRAEDLTDLAARLQRGERDARAPRSGPRDELSDLAVAFDQMALALDERMATVSREVASWRHQAEHDPLTGLANRLALDARLRRELAAGTGASLLLVDLDRFKDVNDRLGHDAGDAVLVAAARRMRAVVRTDDLVARRGGDEFAIVLAHSPAVPFHPFAFAERLITVLGRPYRVRGQDAVIGASVGIAVCPDVPVDLDLLYETADQALYRAKTAGRGVARLSRVPAPSGGTPPALEEAHRVDVHLQVHGGGQLQGT